MEDCRGRGLCPCLDFFHLELDLRAASRGLIGAAVVEMEEQSLLDAAVLFQRAIPFLPVERFVPEELVELSFPAELFFRQVFLFL